MAKEIERKFLVTDDSYKAKARSSHHIVQAYLNSDPEATVRLRIAGDSARITVKSRNHGCERGEWEYPIPADDARAMLASCRTSGIISKTRHIVDAGNGLLWEVDEFEGPLSPLVVAEIELPAADTPLPCPLPSFIGREVTGDTRYYNSSLVAKL